MALRAVLERLREPNECRKFHYLISIAVKICSKLDHNETNNTLSFAFNCVSSSCYVTFYFLQEQGHDFRAHELKLFLDVPHGRPGNRAINNDGVFIIIKPVMNLVELK